MKSVNSLSVGFKIILVFLSFAVADVGVALAPSPAPLKTFVHDNPLVFAPKGAAVSGKKYPLVLLLHGYAGNQDIMDTYFGYSEQVEKRGFILIVPNGLKDSGGWRYWNASSGCCDFDHRENDDVAYTENLIKTAIAHLPVDLTRIYIVGHSNGGFMAHRLACEFGDVVTGIVSFAGEEPVSGNCLHAKPLAVLQIHAPDDDTINFLGDPKGYHLLAGYPGTMKTISDWMMRETCSGSLQNAGRLNLTTTIPGADTTLFAARGCRPGSAVELWKIDAHQGLFHFPHSPFLRDEFTTRTLDFIFSHARL